MKLLDKFLNLEPEKRDRIFAEAKVLLLQEAEALFGSRFAVRGNPELADDWHELTADEQHFLREAYARYCARQAAL